LLLISRVACEAVWSASEVQTKGQACSWDAHQPGASVSDQLIKEAGRTGLAITGDLREALRLPRWAFVVLEFRAALNGGRGPRRSFENQALFGADLPADYYPQRRYGGYYREQRWGDITPIAVSTSAKPPR
jgi:hypothetical protein